LLVRLLVMALLAILAPVRAKVPAQLAAILAPLLLVRLLLLEVILQGRPVGGEFGLVRLDGRLVVRSAVLRELLAIVDHLLVRRLDLRLVRLDGLGVAVDPRLVGSDLLIPSYGLVAETARMNALWGRVFAALYDLFLWWGERRGLAQRRQGLLAQAQGRVLEVGAGTGLNLRHYGAGVIASARISEGRGQ
jgi:hypothetical protein